MSEDLNVLLMGTAGPSEQLKSLLEKQKIFGDRARLAELENMVRLADPALIIQFGKEGAQEAVDLLQSLPPHLSVRLVVIANRSELLDLRKLDRNVVVSLLATDMPDSVLAARIVNLARKRDGGPSTIPPAVQGSEIPPAVATTDRPTAAPSGKLGLGASPKPSPLTALSPAPKATTHRSPTKPVADAHAPARPVPPSSPVAAREPASQPYSALDNRNAFDNRSALKDHGAPQDSRALKDMGLKDAVPSSSSFDDDDGPSYLNEKTVEVSVAEALALRAPTLQPDPEPPRPLMRSEPRDVREKHRPEQRSVVQESAPRDGTHVTKPMHPPSTLHVLVADADIMRGDAIARNLRQNGILTLLVPLDPAKTRWPLVRQFEPQLLCADNTDLLAQGEVWHQLLMADQALSKVRVAQLPFDTIFDETTGAVDLAQLTPFIPSLSGAPYREPMSTLAVFPTEVTDLDPTGIEELPASDRPTFFNEDLRDQTSALRTSAISHSQRTRLPQPVVASVPPEGKSLGRKVLGVGIGLLILAGLGVAMVKGGMIPGLRAHAPPPPPAKPKVVDGDAHAPVPSPPEPAPFSPWVVPSNQDVKTCEQLVPHIEELRKLGVGQATISWNNARKALVLGNLEDAQRSFCESSLIHPTGQGVEGLVELLLSKHAPERAAEWVEFVKMSRPDRRKTLDLEGDIRSQLGKVEEARAAWATALNVNPTDEAAQKGIGDHYTDEGNTFLKSENWSRAEVMFRRAATLNPQSAAAAAGLARTFLAQNYSDHAKVWADTALELRPDFGPALVVRADLVLLGGDQLQAVELYKQALKTDPGNPRAHQQIYKLTQKN